MNKPFPVLGFDIGGTKIAICLAMSDGTVVASGRVDNKMKKPDEVLPQVVAEGERILASAGVTKQQLRAIGISSPSPMESSASRKLISFNCRPMPQVPA